MRIVRMLRALARYRFLLLIRSTGAAVGFSIALAVLIGGALPSLEAFMRSWVDVFREAPTDFRETATGVARVYALHSFVLLLLCCSFGVSQARRGSASDLFAVVPLRPHFRFWGDAAGIFGVVLSIHICLLPALSTLVALSPIATSVMWKLEGIIVILAGFGSCAASWGLRAETWRWSMTRLARAASLLIMAVMTLLVLATWRWIVFLDATTGLFTNPGARSWEEFVFAFSSPRATALVFGFLYVSFLAFFFWHSSRQAAEV